MFSSHKALKIAGVVIITVFLLSLVIIIGIGLSEAENRDETQIVNLYFYNQSTNRLEAERREIAKYDDFIENLEMVMYQLILGPKSSIYSKTIPIASGEGEGLRIADDVKAVTRASERIIEITFSKEYLDLSIAEELILRGSLVYTLTDIEGVDSVSISVENADGVVSKLVRKNGQMIDEIYREDIIINPVLTAEKVNTQTVTLYFPNRDMTGLLPEKRVLEVTDSAIEAAVIESILAGPELPNAVAPLSSDVQIIDVTTTNERICYIDFSTNFLSKLPQGEKERELCIYAIVNSITMLSEDKDTSRSVQFLLNGYRIEDSTGGIDLSQTFTQNEELILN